MWSTLADFTASVTSGGAATQLLTLLVSTLGLALRSPLLLGIIPPLASRFTSPNPTYWGVW